MTKKELLLWIRAWFVSLFSKASNAVIAYASHLPEAKNRVRFLRMSFLDKFGKWFKYQQFVRVSIRSRMGAGVIVGLITLVAVAIAIPIGYIVLANVVNTVPSSSLTLSQSSNLQNISTQVTNAFLLTTVLPTVLAAGLIIGSLFLFFHFRTTRGGE